MFMSLLFPQNACVDVDVCRNSCGDLHWRTDVQDGQIYGVRCQDPQCVIVCNKYCILFGENMSCYVSFQSLLFFRFLLLLQATVYPVMVLALKVTKPPGFRYQSGMYVFVQCPELSKFEW